jgi:hypothetical protein
MHLVKSTHKINVNNVLYFKVNCHAKIKFIHCYAKNLIYKTKIQIMLTVIITINTTQLAA